jgi:hypothetical protein
MRKAAQRGLWVAVVKMLRSDAGITEREAASRLRETFGDKRSTIASNLNALCFLCGGKRANDGEFTLLRRNIYNRGTVYRVLGGSPSQSGILKEIAACLMRKEGASRDEILEHLFATFPTRNKAALVSTVKMRLSIWASILPARGSQAVFSMSLGDCAQVFRVR